MGFCQIERYSGNIKIHINITMNTNSSIRTAVVVWYGKSACSLILGSWNTVSQTAYASLVGHTPLDFGPATFHACTINAITYY